MMPRASNGASTSMPNAMVRFSPRKRSACSSRRDRARCGGRGAWSSTCLRSRAGALRRDPSTSRSSGYRAVAVPGVREVPHVLHAGVRIALAVDRLRVEGVAGGVVLKALVGTDLRLALELVGRGRPLRRLGVVLEEGPDLHLHAFVEEEVAVGPELGGEEVLQRLDLVEADRVAFLERRGALARVLCGEGRRGQDERHGDCREPYRAMPAHHCVSFRLAAESKEGGPRRTTRFPKQRAHRRPART
jgi:hypothetical protein